MWGEYPRGEMSGGNVGGDVRGEMSGGKCPRPGRLGFGKPNVDTSKYGMQAMSCYLVHAELWMHLQNRIEISVVS